METKTAWLPYYGYVLKLLAIGILVPILVLGVPNVYASESNAKRYNDGYNNGFDWYANHPNDGANNCDPQQLYTTGNGHSSTYCNGWSDGYTAASNGGSNSGPQQQPQQGGRSDNGYNLNVHISSHAFGNPSVNVEAKTANGNYDQTYSVNVQNPDVTFNIPANSGPSVQVCMSNSGILGALTGSCHTFDATGSDLSVTMSP